jgi:murein DD-endopeptidase MepM/ murein hydrolase activator NlpD
VSSRPIRLTRRGHAVVAAVGIALIAVQSGAVVTAQAGSAVLRAVDSSSDSPADLAERQAAAARANRAERLATTLPAVDAVDDDMASRPAVSEPVPGAPITAVFGQQGSMWQSRHTGLDFDGVTGDKVRAVSDAEVGQILHHPVYGTVVILRRDDGVEIWYAHLSKASVAPGDPVAAGDVVGRMGTSGNSSGSHLHLEVRVNNVPTDPAVFLWGATPGQPAGYEDWVCQAYAGRC